MTSIYNIRSLGQNLLGWLATRFEYCFPAEDDI
jgi:hypothetical protein